MMKKMKTLDEILENNPNIDVRLLGESAEIAAELRKHGVKKKDFNLAAPGSRLEECTPLTDPRTVHLSRT